ncbi:MAG: hypothetical protein ACI9E1_000349 [Cryomorphaceae bacterium]|jgi:hypothetical protein
MKSLFIILGLLPVMSVSAEQKLNYDDHILPIFEKSCTNCHNPDKRKGDLDLSTYGGFLTGSSGGEIASVGDGAGSKVFSTATHSEEPFMPPKGKGDKLDKKDIMQIRRWIDAGLLETKDSKAKKDNTPKIDFSKINANQQNGPAPLPVNLSLDPVTTPKIAGVISDIECSPTAPVLAITSQQQILLFHTDSLELIGVIPFPKSKKGEMNPESLSFHPAGKFLLVGGGVAGKSGLTVCWDVTNGKTLMTVAREYDTVIATSLRKDLKGIATGGPSKRVKLWDASTNTLEFNHKKHTDWVTSLSYSHDGVLLASGGRGGGVWIWEAHSGNEFHKLSGHKGRIVASKWSPDSNYLATASEDGTLRIWNMRDGKEVKKIEAHKGGILDMDWSSKGEFVTVGRDGFIKIWKSDYGLKKQFHHQSELPLRAEWSHDSKRVFVADFQGAISVWDADLKPIGLINGNPKPVADRIKGYLNKMSQQQQKLAEINAKVAIAEKHVLDLQSKIKNTQQQLVNHRKVYQLAQRNLSINEAKHKHTQQEIPKIQAQIRKADAEIKKLGAPEKAELLKLVQTNSQPVRDRLIKAQAEVKLSQANIQKHKAEFNKLKGQDKPLTNAIIRNKKDLSKAQKNRDEIMKTREPVEKRINIFKQKSQRLRDHLSQ